MLVSNSRIAYDVSIYDDSQSSCDHIFLRIYIGSIGKNNNNKPPQSRSRVVRLTSKQTGKQAS